MTSRILAALLTLTLGLLLGALLPLGYAMANQHEQDYRSGTLTIAHTLAAAAEERLADREKSTMLPRTLAALRTEDEGGAAMTVAVIDDDGHVVEGERTGLYTPARAAPALAGHTRVTRDGDRLLAAVPVDGHSEKVAGAVLLSRPLAPLHDRVMRLWTRLAMIAVLAIAAAIILAVALARWAGRPLRDLETAAEALGAGELGARANPPKQPAEIRRLTERFNVMAARLESLVHDHRTMLADVSHQLRTPLTALRLRMELLAAEPAADAAEFDGALEELARLARLVDGLLAVARAENATEPPQQVMISQLLIERAEAWRPVAAERNVDLSAAANEPVSALAVPGHLEQVIDNLIDNALTAAPPSGHVRLTARRSGHRTQIIVTDDGPGMSETTKAEAFRRFRTSGSAGTGLGLAIVHRLVTADGGTVELSDTPGNGLTVTLDLPATTR
ncbi:HAMP domain-containing sensor histidine kinase [Actinomadura sp. DC4]|uniref:sensor histidine kinase n=1 Tax=Actinomadura sp. DC4 TaxID=3055069 RepID=UPI0025B0E67E|nr:HAMP domain-containing sensor histidine kinase [Actinomadura sp. DC4]MDN3359787.1 HAMP domain-containing sensor histidine kinase [Actinomadura sp. DC4]